MTEDEMDSVGMSLSKLEEMVKGREAWRTAVHGAAKRWNNNKGIKLNLSIEIKK